MKKLIVSLLAISFFMLAFCGCESDIRATPITLFTADAVIKTEDVEIESVVEVRSIDNIRATLSSPKEISGLTYERVNSSLYIEYNDLKCITEKDYLSSDNPFDILIDTLVSMNTTALVFEYTQDEFDVYSGMTPTGEYKAYFDSKSGYLFKIEPTFTDVKIIFSNIEI